MLSRWPKVPAGLAKDTGVDTTGRPQRLLATHLDTPKKIDAQPGPKRDTVDLIHELQRTRQPIILTISGKAHLVVEDMTSLRLLVKLVDRLDTIEAIREGLASIDRGEGRPAEEVFEEIRQKYNIPRDA